MDNRGACSALIGIAERLSLNKPACDVYIVGRVGGFQSPRGHDGRPFRQTRSAIMLTLPRHDTQTWPPVLRTRLAAAPACSCIPFTAGALLTAPPASASVIYARPARPRKQSSAALCRFGLITDAANLLREQDGVACLKWLSTPLYPYALERLRCLDLEKPCQTGAAVARGRGRDYQLNRY